MATGKTTKRTFTGRKSKVDAVAHLVGKVSDRELAEQIGVTPENVRTWRKRRGIEATWQTDAAAAPAEAPKPRAKPKRKKKRKAKGASRRKSKLDPWFDQLGAVPDRQIADAELARRDGQRGLVRIQGGHPRPGRVRKHGQRQLAGAAPQIEDPLVGLGPCPLDDPGSELGLGHRPSDHRVV